MTSVFSDFVRSLRPEGDPPDPAVFDRLLGKLRGALVYELKKRSLWSSPPSYLGIYGGTQWTDGDLLEELLLDCYLFIFIRRLPGLKKQLTVRKNIDGLVFLNIRNFLYDTQRRHDPLGFRIFEVLQAAVLHLLEVGVLHLLAGDARIRNDTVLGFSAWNDVHAANDVDLRPHVMAWNNELLPDLITAWSKDDVQSQLESFIAGLADEGFETFHFQALIEPLKDDARARWQAIRMDSEGAGFPTGSGDEITPGTRWVRPDRGFEDRQSFQRLLGCVAEGLEQLEERRKTKEYLHQLWLFFRDWTADPEPRSSDTATAGGALDFGERAPSDKKLSELLQIPRGRIPGLRTVLGRLVEDCRNQGSRKPEGERVNGEVHDGGASYGQRSDANSEGRAVMDAKSRREQLRLQTGQAAALSARDDARHAERGGQAPRPGETFIFPEANALPVEWGLLELDAADPQRALVAPADDRPFAGSRDVTTIAGGTTVLRCGLAIWLDAQALDTERRVGMLDPEILERARHKQSEIADGTLRATISEQEADGSPEYLGWTRMLVDARTALPGDPRPASPDAFWESKSSTVVPFSLREDRQEGIQVSSRKDPRVGYALAATLAAATIGLSFWVERLRTELSGPILLPAPAGPEVVFRDRDRIPGPQTLTATATESRVSVYLVLSEFDDYSTYRVELLEKHGDGILWKSEELANESQFLLALPRDLLTVDEYRFRLYGSDEAGKEKFLEELEVQITVK